MNRQHGGRGLRSPALFRTAPPPSHRPAIYSSSGFGQYARKKGKKKEAPQTGGTPSGKPLHGVASSRGRSLDALIFSQAAASISSSIIPIHSETALPFLPCSFSTYPSMIFRRKASAVFAENTGSAPASWKSSSSQKMAGERSLMDPGEQKGLERERLCILNIRKIRDRLRRRSHHQHLHHGLKK